MLPVLMLKAGAGNPTPSPPSSNPSLSSSTGCLEHLQPLDRSQNLLLKDPRHLQAGLQPPGSGPPSAAIRLWRARRGRFLELCKEPQESLMGSPPQPPPKLLVSHLLLPPHLFHICQFSTLPPPCIISLQEAVSLQPGNGGTFLLGIPAFAWHPLLRLVLGKSQVPEAPSGATRLEALRGLGRFLDTSPPPRGPSAFFS